jgi:ABC-type nickel/cobalt efflux system permease component RcnA
LIFFKIILKFKINDSFPNSVSVRTEHHTHTHTHTHTLTHTHTHAHKNGPNNKICSHTTEPTTTMYFN